MNPLPHCDELFLKFLDPWYDEQWRQWKGFVATRPDIMTAEKYIGLSGEEVSPLDVNGRAEVAKLIGKIHDAAKADGPQDTAGIPLTDLDWIGAFDNYYDRKQIAQMIKESNPEDFGNPYLVRCCEFGAVLAATLQKKCPSLEWVYGWPYWESSLLHPPTGIVIPIFHWAIKKMSEYGVDDGYIAKINACLAMIDNQGC